MLDLDGDGLELTRADGSLLFDHNADGIRASTGWIGGDDGILVRDLNGNGAVDSGRELFGIDTLKSDGRNAVNGFDALADLDSNGDGQLTAADLAWSQVEVWRDLDQDGVSDAGELFGLDQLGITRVGVVGSTGADTGVNGNLIAQSASFTREADGVQVTRTVGAIDLDSNPFYREFTAAVPLNEQARSLPSMQGSGRARDLAEAVSLSPALGTSLAAFSTATTRDAQRALLDGLITQWAQGSGFWQSLETTLDGKVTIGGLPAGMTEAQYRNLVGVLEVFNGERFYSTGANGTPLTAGTTRISTTDAATNVARADYGIAPTAGQLQLLQQSYGALKESIYDALVVQTRLKPYMDAIALTVDDSGIRFDTAALASLLDQRKAAGEREAIIDLAELQYYEGPTLRSMGFASLDKLYGWVEALPAASPLRAELAVLHGVATSGTDKSDIYLGDARANSFGGAAGDDLLEGGAGDDVLDGGADNDILNGGAGADSLYGQTGADVLTGGAGNDNLYGGAYSGGGASFGDNDTLDGGAGNDYLVGGFGSDTYLFGRGDGQDTINNVADTRNGSADPDANKQDVLRFKDGVLAGDVSVSRSSDDLVLKIKGTTDQVTIQSYFDTDGFSARGFAVDQIRFADGTAWTLSDVKAQALIAATAGNDTIIGYATDDVLAGLAGNDTLQGRAGNDVLDGGLGDDSLSGQEGADRLDGGAGNDSLDGGADNDALNGGDGADKLYGQTGADVLTGGAGNDSLYGGGEYGGGASFGDNDTLDGGAGNDAMMGGFGSDTYLFGRGDGQDTINNDADAWNKSADPDANKQDVLRFKDGVLAGDVSVSRSSDDLVLKIKGTTDQVTIQSYFDTDGFSARGFAVDQIRFADGTAWTLSDVKAQALIATAGNDAITGYATDDVLAGLAGNDTLQGRAGNDVLDGGLGDDSLSGQDGADLLDGGAGNDSLDGGADNDRLNGGDGADNLYGQTGADVLIGGAGNDNLYGGNQYGGGASVGDNDTLDGGAGNDAMMGGFGSDTYLFGRGDGQDTINNDADTRNGSADPDANKQDVLRFKDGVLAGDVSVSRSSDNLILKLNGTTDQVTLQNYFVGDGVSVRGSAVDQIRFADGTTWMLSDVKAKALIATAGNDEITGYATDDVLAGLAGNDTLQGRAGNDVLDGGLGDDSLSGQDGADLLYGGAGNDSLDGGADNDTLSGGDGSDNLYGQAGVDVLTGGAGNDSLYGGSQFGGGASFGDNDTLDGGAGNDYLVGGYGSDAYLFGRGDGQDTINNDSDTKNGSADPDANKQDVLRFKDGVLAGDVSVSRSSDDLVLKIKGTTDQVTIQSYFSGDGISARGFAVNQIQFADGTTWTLADIKTQALTGGAGNDTLIGYAGADTLSGSDGNDTLQGRAGDDTLRGGAGNDILAGGRYDAWNGYYDGWGNDTYQFNRGDGQDRIVDVDATPGNTDVVAFGSDVAYDQLWFRHVGNDLEVSVIGTNDKVTVGNWYAGSANHVEQFKTSDLKVLLDKQVDLLVAAMAAFAPPAPGQTSLPPDYQTALYPVLAANWK